MWTTVGSSGLAVLAVAVLSACKGDSELLGRFGGDWDLGGAVMLTYADGGAADFFTEKGHPQRSESEVVISTTDQKSYRVTLDTPFMACQLTAQLNDAKELVLDGPSTTDVLTGPHADALGRWQHCTFTLGGYRGEANVRGTVRSRPGGSITVTMQVLPLGSSGTRITEGSAASAGFVGNRGRTVTKK